ncbi:YihY/virulence factor BrkB family protein [Streptomyces sp. NEAU-W12]|uniref:YihY/virulence factor BrkB family protein n=1 Tax=Streptomyces sp. NEAU-W12 TaxID=2994668 RepID=UPI00224B59DD|nr:YhjD/YihY/BrkB family envelope integrity protein [Streptomyces sp. NEAU-W12]MCX2927573.1 YihY family inner membrane protein [Streptomyces sp. NEAU-W12]
MARTPGWHRKHGEQTSAESSRGGDRGAGSRAVGSHEAEGRQAEDGRAEEFRAEDRRAEDRRAEAERAPDAGPDEQVEERAPDSPTDLPKRSWMAVLKGTLKEFKKDELADRAAALTYYSILALFPALLALVSLLGIVGQSTTQTVLDNIEQLAPGAVQDVLRTAVQQMQGQSGLGSLVAIAGLLLAVWSASGYVAAFIRSANGVYDVPEGRPVWKVLPVRVGVTVVLMVMAVVSSLIVVFTGSLAQQVGGALGIGDTALTVWSIAKWPVLLLLVTIMIAILYWATPNAKVRGFRWLTPGSFLALLIWMIASAGFAVYVANFGSYNKTYGTFAGVIIFLVWLWITNLAILLGLEFDAELARQRAVAGGHPAGEEPYVQPRDTRKWDEEDRRRLGNGGPRADRPDDRPDTRR